jgi:hypothetical protein
LVCSQIYRGDRCRDESDTRAILLLAVLSQCPEYEGVIDDEEFTSYLYDTAPELWEIAEDPLGMAKAELNDRRCR